MLNELEFYRSPAGNSPVEAYIRAQNPVAQAALWEAIRSFMIEFPSLVTVSVKHLRGKVWEIRVHDDRNLEHRLLFAVVGKSLCLLHAFTKKTQKTPDRK